MDARRASISEAELEVLKVLWESGSATVRTLHERLRRQGRRWAYTTVLTLLQRLEAKGYVASDKSGVAHVFRPAVTRDKLLRQRLKDLANQLCEGTRTLFSSVEQLRTIRTDCCLSTTCLQWLAAATAEDNANP